MWNIKKQNNKPKRKGLINREQVNGIKGVGGKICLKKRAHRNLPGSGAQKTMDVTKLHIKNHVFHQM